MRTTKIFFQIILIIALVVSFARPVLAVKTGISDEYPTLMRGVRPLGMGNAFIAMPGTDFIAPFYNPAAINDFEDKREYTVGVPMVQFNTKFFPAATDLLSLKHNLKTGMSVAQKVNLFKSYTDKYLGQYTNLMTAMPLFQVRHKYYALSAVGDFRMNLSFRNITFPNFDFKVASSSGIHGGLAYGFFNESLQIGGNLKMLFRMGKEDEITSADIIVNSIQKLIGFQTWRKGVGVGADIGVKYKFPFLDVLKPAIGVVLQDIGDTRFTGDAPIMPMSFSTGIGIAPMVGKVQLAVMADFRELNKEEDFLKKFHAGIEAKFPEMRGIKTQFSLRAGCNQGYPAFGLSAKWPLATLMVAYYGEEAGDYTHSKASYRLATQVMWEF